MTIRAGFAFENPVTGSRIKVLEADAQTGSRSWLLEVRCRAGAPADIPEHIHLDWTEEFEIIAGTANYKVGGVQRTAAAGDKFVVAPGELHIHPWSAGQKLLYRQRSHFGAPDPTAVTDVIGVFATVAQLARAGKVDAAGMPKHPLQLAATMRTLTKHGGYDAKLPVAAQNVLSATLGRVAEAFGFRGVDPSVIGK